MKSLAFARIGKRLRGAALPCVLLAACTSDDPAASADAGDSPTPTAARVALVCATGIAEEHEFELHATQAYRWTIPADGSAFTLERGALTLFASTPELALDYAGQAHDALQPAERSEVTAEVELSGDGALRVTWEGASLQADETLAGMYEGTLAIGEERRAAACWREDFATPYRYDADDGECRDEDGEVGRHRVPLQYVRETGDGECNDFATDELAEILDWPVFAGWNLRGADLSRASMHFAFMPDADLAGVQMRGFSIGYAGISGRGDVHTTIVEGWTQTGDLDALYFGDASTPPSEQPTYYAWRFLCSERMRAAHCEDVVEGVGGD